jgi:hypothetical protein
MAGESSGGRRLSFPRSSPDACDLGPVFTVPSAARTIHVCTRMADSSPEAMGTEDR